jgi:hypothetical protein
MVFFLLFDRVSPQQQCKKSKAFLIQINQNRKGFILSITCQNDLKIKDNEEERVWEFYEYSEYLSSLLSLLTHFWICEVAMRHFLFGFSSQFI